MMTGKEEIVMRKILSRNNLKEIKLFSGFTFIRNKFNLRVNLPNGQFTIVYIYTSHCEGQYLVGLYGLGLFRGTIEDITNAVIETPDFKRKN
jgi:hypothetical protein